MTATGGAPASATTAAPPVEEVFDLVEIRVLGPLQVRRVDGTFVEPREWRTAKTADLLRLLALRAGQPVPVAVLLEALWPAVDETKGRASLRNALSQLRRAIGSDCVERRLDGLVLKDAWVDAVAFTELAAEARRAAKGGDIPRALAVTREAEALYLDHFRAHDTDGQWVAEEREALAHRYLTLIADAADLAVEVGAMRDAVDLASRVLAIDPCSERAYRAVMHGYAGLGETQRALREYESCRSVLADELGVDPSPQTRALHLQLLSADPVAPSAPPFVGRESEAAWLAPILEGSVRDGHASVICVGGVPGIGRARLVDEVARRLGVRHVEVSLPSGDNVVDVLARRLAVAVAGPAGGEPAEPGADPLRALAVAVGRCRPVVVTLRDADVLDGDDLGRIVRTVLREQGPAVLALLTGPPPAGTPPTSDLRSGRVPTDPNRIRRLVLRPLVPEEVGELASGLLAGSPVPALVDELVRTTQGVPGDVVATVRAWSTAGRIATTTAGLALMPVDASGPDLTVQPLLLRALERLHPQDVEVLQLAALLDRPATAALLAPVLEGTATQQARSFAQRALDHLADLSVLLSDSGAYTFRHPLLQDAVRAWVRPSTRRVLHQRIAERAPLPATERLQHWLSAGEPELACAAALDASREAMSEGRPTDARSHLLRVVTLSDVVSMAPADRQSLFERLGDSCAVLGRQDEAREAYTTAAAAALAHAPEDAGRIQLKLAAVGDEAWLEHSAAGFGCLPSPTRREAPEHRLGIDVTAGPDPDVEDLLREIVHTADTAGDVERGVAARLMLAEVVSFPRRQFSQGSRWAEEALTLAVAPTSQLQAMLTAHVPDLLLGNARKVAGMLEGAVALAGPGIGPDRIQLDWMLALLAHDLGQADAFAQAWDVLEASVAAAGTADLDWLRVRLLTERGLLARAQEVDATPVPEATTPVARQLRQLSSAALQQALGDSKAAAVILRSAVDDALAVGCTLALPEITARLVMIEAYDDDDHAAAEAFDLFDWAVGTETAMPRESCWRLLARAAIRAAHGDLERACLAAANAVKVAADSDLVVLEAQALRARAGYLDQAGHTAEARLAAASALRCYRTAGVESLARRLEGMTLGWSQGPTAPWRTTRRVEA